MRNEKFWTWFETEAKPLLKSRKDTFTKMFEYLDALDRPVGIIETGCTRDIHPTMQENWGGDGRSTVLFDRYVYFNGGRVYSLELDPEAVASCRKLVSHRTKVICGDSVKRLTMMAAKPPKNMPYLDLLYLDSFDLLVSHPVVAASHHINELTAIMPLINDDTLVVVDDAPQVFYDSILPRVEVGGKAMFVAKHAEQVGADLEFYNYQVGWTKMKGPERLPNGYGDIVQFTDTECCHMIDRARAHVEKGHNIQAEPIYRVILGRTSPAKTGVTRVAHAEACLFYARLAVAKLRYGTACDWYREALNVDPRDVEARSEMCIQALRPMANWKIAQQEMVRATKIEPDNARAWRTLGGIEHEMGNVEATVACYDRQLELAPDDPHAMLDRCTIAMDLADYDGARELLAKVMKTDRWPDAVHCLAMIAYREGRHEEAVEGYKKAIENKCYDHATAHWNMSLALHSIGRYREGWIEHEWRKYEQHSTALSLPMLRFITPMWDGKKPPPAKIHVHAEAGMGDNIAMSRYLNVLVEMGYEVTYEIFQEMFDLMTRSFPNVRVIPRAADYPGCVGIPHHDYHIPVGSLPAVLETDIDTVPWSGPYLRPDPELVKKRYLATPLRKIGLCWSSGIRDTGIWIREYGLRKSMKFDTMKPLLNTDNAFVSLQVGPERAENQRDIPDTLPDKPTWDDTCALIANLDLIITVDTAVAHAAGAMGKPVWVLAQNDAQSWHWMAERPGSPWNTKSPWYPSARVFRQHEVNRPHYWDEVIEDVRRELERCKESQNMKHAAVA